MRLLHTSDWHLGISFKGADAAEDQVYFIDQIKSIIKEYKIDALLIAGDVFDRSVASAEAVSLYDSAVTGICAELGIKLFIIAGNHDGAERLAQCSALLEKSGLYISGSLRRPAKGIRIDDTELFLLPWISTDKVRALYPENADSINSMYDAYKLVCDEIRDNFTPGLRHIIAAHAFVVNAETSVSDRAAEIGFVSAISADVFAGFDYAALGHIHKPQDIGENIRYSGTPMPYSFGREETQEKSVTLIDTADMHREIIPLKLLHKRTTISGSMDELLKADYPEEIKKGYTRIVVTDRQLGLETISYLRERYANPLEISGRLYESDSTAVTLTQEELEHMENTPSEIFMHFYMDTEGEEPDEHIMELFMAAQSQSEEAGQSI